MIEASAREITIQDLIDNEAKTPCSFSFDYKKEHPLFANIKIWYFSSSYNKY